MFDLIYFNIFSKKYSKPNSTIFSWTIFKVCALTFAVRFEKATVPKRLTANEPATRLISSAYSGPHNEGGLICSFRNSISSSLVVSSMHDDYEFHSTALFQRCPPCARTHTLIHSRWVTSFAILPARGTHGVELRVLVSDWWSLTVTF